MLMMLINHFNEKLFFLSLEKKNVRHFCMMLQEKIDEEDESVGGHFSNYCFGFTIDILH